MLRNDCCTQIGLAVAYPIMQAGLFVAALWGIVLFNELPGQKSRLRFLVDGSIVVLGVLLLGLSLKHPGSTGLH
jgi:glucose uptake protein GlcU